MTAGGSDCPARTVYDTLAAAPAALAPRRYRELIDELEPLWIEDVVCPIQVAVHHLHAAAVAVIAGDEVTAKASHEAARTHLYDALSTVGLLTLEEQLQEAVVQDLLRDTQVGQDQSSSGGYTLTGWRNWRRIHGG
ncbi:MAG TPA: hypothetical protein VM287_02850 [Egibacteraceae bacterium]|nr:hypothetical protein [Egibacteraceae bacterium]